jgi:hypothetical protein
MALESTLMVNGAFVLLMPHAEKRSKARQKKNEGGKRQETRPCFLNLFVVWQKVYDMDFPQKPKRCLWQFVVFLNSPFQTPNKLNK